ncbi:cytidylate kinase-like family protein [Clostridium boliviensis]|uniref:Cytidylate kinase-like family protein n=1 Tax=Clostridium boliviensis TaxID=318465 RepID=A0ABU4GNS9_9CLOT|nr:cytidylate kinase-like family protein [Clostridium boliviensis]MDW2799261.1 cytidylate kinase-like family protein [Clostridium boliviensis]
MNDKSKFFAIAITRTCGSGGGSYIGKKLAADYGIDYYDKKILKLATEDGGVNKTIFEETDEKMNKTVLYQAFKKVYNGEIIPAESGNFLLDQSLFNYQAKVLKELLNRESYVCVGRAADFVLKEEPNVVSVYLDASYEFRVKHEMARQGISQAEAKHYIDQLDRYRNAYYLYHTGKQWKNPRNFDLCLNTERLGFNNCTDLIEEYIRMKFGICPEKKERL